MGRRTRTWLRRGTALALAVGLAVLVAVAVHRARRLDTPVLGVNPPEGHQEGEGETVARYIEFQYRESDSGRLVFELTSARTLGFSSGWHEIEGVRLQLYDKGQPSGVLTCDLASFNRQTRDARLSGGVHLEFPSGGFLNTERAHFDASSRQMITDTEVLFSSEGVVGQAGEATYALEGDRLLLTEGVTVQGGTGDALRAPRVVYQRAEARVLFPEGCSVRYGGLTVTAPRSAVELEGRDGPPLRIAMTDGVDLEGTIPGKGDRVDGWFERLLGERDPRGNWQVQGHTSAPWLRLAFLSADGSFLRSLATQSLRAVVAPDGILNAQAALGVCMREIPPSGPVREAEGEQARLWFADGEPTDAEIEGDVELRGGAFVGRGQRARVAARGGVAMLHGDPAGHRRAVLVSDRGEVQCDQAQLFEGGGGTHARGNVQGRLESATLLGSADESDGDGQVLHFAGEVLDVDPEGEEYRLREDARAWQAHRLLLADEIVYRPEQEALTATGHVRTTFPASQINPSDATARDAMVVSRSLEYQRSKRQAVYTGSVTYTDAEHILSASVLTVNFDETDEISTLQAEGAVELTDLVTGRRMQAETAVHDVAARTIHLTGEPVKLTEASGTTVQADSLTWNQASGTVTVAGDTETIYYPEATP